MTPERLLAEEQLVLAAAELPTPSAELRTRVLTAAFARRERRVLAGHVATAGGLLIAFLGLTAWLGPRTVARDDPVETGDDALETRLAAQPDEPILPLLDVSLRHGRGESLFSAEGDDWRLIEAELESRREGFRQIGISD
jgi:hypothetical protein